MKAYGAKRIARAFPAVASEGHPVPTRSGEEDWKARALAAEKEVAALNEALAEEHAKAEVAYARGLAVHAEEASAAEADNAALLAALRSARESLGEAQPNIGWGTPPRLACGRAYDAAGATIDQPHPGAALLEELEGLRRQVAESKVGHLVRAEILKRERDAALEEAAQTAGDVAAKYDSDGLRIDENTGARIIAVTTAKRALKVKTP
ncbi:hypothetical protein Mx8p83 [Myxococcus phage Mx8]|uniref:p83 n=1 Tax=Myxococcus phage Mx8 TaxID=49964 RepID=Q94MN6_9CAUD|nr:hypothetical protein Mx8p83 [Myxococcus phage Mx8]AAK94418.1 p83 [Myxococcus phage Mx8]